jgi:rhamnosyltransferase subunit B
LRRELGLPEGENPIFDAKHSPRLVLALFSRVLGDPQPDWPRNTLVTGFAFYDGDAGKTELAPEVQQFLANGHPPLVFTLGSAAVMAAGDFYEESARAAELVVSVQCCWSVMIRRIFPGSSFQAKSASPLMRRFRGYFRAPL